MPSRRQIREAAVQFLYGYDLEGGGDPRALRDSFWAIATESDRRKLALAAVRTLHHLNLGREERLDELHERAPTTRARLAADPALEGAAEGLDEILEHEHQLGRLLSLLDSLPRDGGDDEVVIRFEPILEQLFAIDRELSAARRRFLEFSADHPEQRALFEPVDGCLRRLERLSERIRMIERPDEFPEHGELAKLRNTREEIAVLREAVDRRVDQVLAEREPIDERLAAVVDNFVPERIDPVDRAILRLGAYEILHDPEVPPAVAINEAIELAKRFGTTDSGRFVNGILDRIAKG